MILYAADSNGNVINIIKKVPHKGKKNHNWLFNGWCKKAWSIWVQKTYQAHRFVWECFYGIIPEGKVIDHIKNDKEDNRLCNLQLFTHQQIIVRNQQKIEIIHSMLPKIVRIRKCVKATNINTNEESYYYSMYAIQSTSWYKCRYCENDMRRS